MPKITKKCAKTDTFRGKLKAASAARYLPYFDGFV
jgi:hypothetical protein